MRKIFLLLSLFAVLSCFPQGKFGFMPIKTFPNIKASFLTASPDGSYLVSEAMNTVQVWNKTATSYEQGIVLSDFIASGLWVNGFAISYDGNLLIVVSSDFMLHVFKRKDGTFKKIQTISDYEGLPWHHSFTPDGKYYMCATSSGEGILWKITEDELVKVSVLKEAMDFHFSPAGDIAYADGKILSFKNEKFVQLQILETKDPKLVNFSPDGNYLAIFGTPPGDDVIYLLKRQANGTYKKTGELLYEEKDPEFIEFSADGRFLASYDHHAVSGRKKIMMYEVLNDSLNYKMSYGAFTDNMERFQFISNGTLAVSGSFREVIVYKVDGVKGNKFYKASSTPSVANNSTEVKKEEVKPKQQEIKTTVKTEPANTGTTINIFWINPNPDVMDDKPVVSEKGTIDIQVKIISNKKIGKEDIKIIINGKEMGKSKFNEVGLKESAQENLFEYTYVNGVPLEETTDHINKIEVIAAGKKCTKPLKVLYSAGKPNLHILVIGTSLDLQFPKKDAQDFADLFKSQAGPEKDKLFGSVEVRKLIGAEATTNAIKESIERYRYDFKNGNIGPRDVMLVFISSHGFIYQDKFRIQGDDYKDIYKETYSVAFEEITSRLKEVQCKKLIFLDACFSGGAKANVADINNAISELNKQGEGVTTFSSSSNDEYSYEDVKWQNGAFTYSIKEGLLKGKADKDANGIVTIEELYEFVSAMVPKIVTEVKNKSQHPTMPVNDLLKKTSIYVIGK